MATLNIDPTEDKLSHYANWYLSTKDIGNIYTPNNDGLLFIEGLTGIVLHRDKSFQVELFTCNPNVTLPEHTHPNVDSYECFLYGMEFTHSGETIIDAEEALQEENGYPIHAYQTIRVRPNDLHGGTASGRGGAFLSLQHWLDDIEPTHITSNWDGHPMGTIHSEQINGT